MEVEEENFPRGGSVKSGSKNQRNRAKNKENDLFQVTSEGPEQKKAKKRVKKRFESVNDAGDPEVVSSIEKFTLATVVSDMLLLGRVQAIHEYKLIISLPENITGEVAITDISPAYTDVLRAVANGEENDEIDIGSLDDLYSVGQLVCCRVKCVKTKSRKKEIHLTLDPKAVNKDIDVDKLGANSLINGSIASREDHGYTVDLGLPGLQAFLTNADAMKYSKGKPLLIGQPVQCTLTKTGIDTIKAKANRVVNVKLMMGKVSIPSKDSSLSNILPGTVITGEVVTVRPAGLIVKFLGKFKGAVHRHHLNTDPSKFSKDQHIKICVLYHLPLAGISYLSMLQHLIEPTSDKSQHHKKVQVGEIVESANVLHIEPNSGALLKLHDDVRGYLPIKHAHDDPKRRKLDELPKTGLKCRIIDFDMMNNVAIVSACKTFLDRSIVNINDCEAGQIVEGKIQRFINDNIIVLIAGFYRGFVPGMHNANVPVKHPEKKYKIDDTIKCRILKVEKSMRHAVSLTAKEALVNSKLPVLKSMDDLEKGMIVEGFVVRINPSGLVVAFYNDVRGFVHKSEAGDDLNVLQENFYVGQVVKCRVISWDTETGKMRLSMKLEGQENIGVKEMKLQASLDAKVTHACQITKINDRGLSVRIGSVNGFIPVHHISDNKVNCKHLLKLFKPHQIIEKVVLFERAATPIFTLKQSILKAIEEHPLPEKLDELLPGMVVPGVVRNAVDFGIFVQISHNIRGVAVNKYLTDTYTENAASLFASGQSVLVSVRETDLERNRVACSLRMSDCYHGDTAPSLEQLTSFLNERKRILTYYASYGRDVTKSLTTFDVGSMIEVEIEQVSDFGSVGHEINSKVKVICTVYHMEGVSVKVGEVRKAIVLHQDLESNCLEITMSKSNVKSISMRVDGPSNRVKVDQIIDAQVLLVKPEFVLIALRGRAEYKLAYAPAQKCMNDVMGSKIFDPGFSDKVLVKSVGDFVVCSWQAFEEKNKFRVPKKIEAHTLDIGSKVRVTIREILPFQLNIRIGAIPGRIFASELETSEFLPGDRLTDKFKPGDELDAVIIGFRETKSQKLTLHMRDARGIPECSALNRRLEGDLTTRDPKPGDQLPGFFYHVQKEQIRFRLSTQLNGDCAFINADFHPKDLRNPENIASGAYYPLTMVSRNKSGVCEVSMIPRTVDIGSVVTGCVLRLKKDALVVRLPWSHRGLVSMTEMSDSYYTNFRSIFREGQYVRCQILGRIGEDFSISLRASRFTPLPMRKEPRDKIIESPNDLVENEIVRGYVHKCAQNAVTILLGTGVYGYVHKNYISDHSLKKVRLSFPKGKLVTVKVVKIGRDVEVSLRKSDTGIPETEDDVTSRKRRNSDRVSESESEEPARKRRTSESERRVSESESPRKRTESGSEFESPALGTRKRKLSEMSENNEHDEEKVDELPHLDLDAESESTDDETEVVKPKPKKKKKKVKVVESADDSAHHLKVNEGFAWVTEFNLPPSDVKNESESSDEEIETPATKDKKLEEKKLVELENRMLDTSRIPETEDEFDRLVVQSPDSSMVWMQYMAHHLKMAEIDKARSIAERALKTISFREEQEKLNVWSALMNLENTYGTQEQLKNVFERAVQMNDTFKIHQQLVKIYENSDKAEHAERLHSSIVRQFGVKKQVWIDFGAFYFSQKRYDSARKILERSLKILDKRDHMEVVTKFGRMEFEHGQNEQAVQLFERVLSECPKRLDVWNVYIDLLMKFSSIEKVRRVFLKLIDIQLAVKKMKSVFKKWLDLETKHGDDSTVNEVKERATKYALANVGN